MGTTDDRATEWTAEEVLAWLAEQGRPMGRDTWHSYVSRGQAPAPVRHVGRTPVWSAASVKEFHANARRPRRRAGTGESGAAAPE